MFNKKILALALIGSLAFELFPTNIFANSNQLAIEKKICENMDKLRYFNIVDNNFYYYYSNDKDNFANADYNYYHNLEKKTFGNFSYPRKDLYENIENNIIKIDGKSFTTRNLEDNEEISYIKKIGDDFYYIISSGGMHMKKEQLYKNNELLLDTRHNKNLEYALALPNNIEIDNYGNIYFAEIEDLGYYDLKNRINSSVYKISNGKKEEIINFKNEELYYSDADGGHYGRKFEIFLLNNDYYIVDYINGYDKDFNILKNGKSLCENLENNTNNGNNTNNNVAGTSAPIDIKAISPKNDERVNTNESKEEKKEKEIRKKVYNKLEEVGKVDSVRGLFDLAYGHLLVNENYYKIDKNGVTYSDSKAEEKIKILNGIAGIFSENSYEVVKKIHEKFNEEETRSLVSESDFVKDFIKEYEKKFDELETKIDSIAYNLPAENVAKIKERVKNFANKYFTNNSDSFFTQVYEILQNDKNIKNKAETSREIFLAINYVSQNIFSQIGKYEITWINDKNKEMGITETKRSEIYNSIK